MKKILIATHNSAKAKEIKEILPDLDLITLEDINCEMDVEEDQETFEGNSKKKAKEISEKTGYPCIADDTGLCIDAFDGWPGVHTARFLGPNAISEDKRKAVLEKMKNLKGEERKAEFKCVATYYENGKYIIGKGEVVGRIAEYPRGNNGFGYDPIFELPDGKTYAELPDGEKNKISHRRKALEDLKKKLDN